MYHILALATGLFILVCAFQADERVDERMYAAACEGKGGIAVYTQKPDSKNRWLGCYKGLVVIENELGK